MRVLLLNPPFLPRYSRSSRSPAVTKSGTIYYPIWLAHAAGLLEKRGHVIMLIDFPAEGKELHEYRDRIRHFEPSMIVCDTSTPSIESDVKTSSEVKSWFSPQPLTVLVGTHPSALPDRTLSLDSSIDIIARREYDLTLCELAGGRAVERINGISYRKNGQVYHNPDRPPIADLDQIPFVSSVYRKHLNIANYFYAHCQNPVISIFAGRGCPNNCFFCVYPQVMFGHEYRHRSVRHFVEELEFIKREMPKVREILIDDDNFTADQDFVEQVCEGILAKDLDVTWTCEARVDLKLDIMKLMKRAGCRLLVAGFESGDQRVLNGMNKGITVSQSEVFARNARRSGLRVHGCFMVGNPGENGKTFLKTIDLAMRLHIDSAQFFPLMVYPGTSAYAWAETKGYLVTDRFRDWLTVDGMHRCVLSTPIFKGPELTDLCDYARRRFYLRPRYVLHRILDMGKNPLEITRTMRAATTLLKHLFREHR